MTRLEVRNLPAVQIATCLVDELGGAQHDGGVSGDGWTVRFVRGEPAMVGRFRVPVLFIEVDGPREQEVAAFVRRKTMRGGG
ncbi:MAG: hypothetical protein Kow0010_00820 [Dehalococcoidia bacterium]